MRVEIPISRSSEVIDGRPVFSEVDAHSVEIESGGQMAKTKKAKSAGASKNRHKVKRAKAAAPRRARTPALPGMEDSAIQPLEDAALAYADIRDQRMALNVEEVGLKATLLRLMKKFGKQTYQRDGVSIEIVAEEETVKVRVKKPEDDNEEDADVGAGGSGESAEA